MNNKNKNEKNFKLLLTEYFSSIINEIDIDTEQLLVNSKYKRSRTTVAIDERLNKTRNDFIHEINEILQYNLKKYEENNKLACLFAEQKEAVFPKYCTYLNRKCLNRYLSSKTQIGVLIITDFYLSDEYIISLKYLLEKLEKIKSYDEDYDSDSEEPEYHGVNLFIIQKMREALRNKQQLVRVCKADIEKIEKISITYQSSEFNGESGCQIPLKEFKNLKKLDLKVKLSELTETFGEKIEELNLSSTEIFAIEPEGLNYKHLRILDLSKNSLNFLDQGIFDRLETLVELDLSSNGLGFIDDDAFVGLKSLKKLDLSSNNIMELTKKSLKGLSNVEEFYFEQKGYLGSLKPGAFAHLNKLKKLTTMTNPFEKNDQIVLHGLSNVEHFEISCFKYKLNFIENNKIKTFKLDSKVQTTISAGFFIRLTHLEELSLRNVTLDLQVLPKMPNLRKLELNKVVIKSFDSFFQPLPALKELIIHNCPVIFADYSKFFKTNSFYQNLEVLDISDLRIGYVMKNFFSEFVNLRELKLNRCVIEGIEKMSFEKLEHLKVLSLAGNDLKKLEENVLCGLKSLKILNLSENKLENIELNAFSNDLLGLENLDLSKNKLKSLPDQVFVHLANLTSLHISENRISSFYNIFKYLNKLEHLMADNSELERLSRDDFRCLPNLKTVCLDDGSLEHIDEDAFYNNPKLEVVALKNNSLESVKNVFKSDKNPLMRHIFLDGNQLESIDLDELSKFEHLDMVEFSDNEIADIDWEMLNHIVNNKIIDMIDADGNPFMEDNDLEYEDDFDFKFE